MSQQTDPNTFKHTKNQTAEHSEIRVLLWFELKWLNVEIFVQFGNTETDLDQVTLLLCFDVVFVCTCNLCDLSPLAHRFYIYEVFTLWDLDRLAWETRQ